MTDELEKIADRVFADVKATAAALVTRRIDPLDARMKDLAEKVDTLSRENAVLTHRIAALEAKGK